MCSAGLCHPLAQCIEGSFRPLCVCPPGYVGGGFGPSGCTRTTSFDACDSMPCLNGGTCRSATRGVSFNCICPVGTVPPVCAISTDPCAHSPCQNGGTCTQINGNRYRCSCPPKYTGMFCQTEVRVCGGVLTGLIGTLKYPPSENYPHNSRCAWLIRTNVTFVLNITFTKFNLESSNDCRFDWLQVRE